MLKPVQNSYCPDCGGCIMREDGCYFCANCSFMKPTAKTRNITLKKRSRIKRLKYIPGHFIYWMKKKEVPIIDRLLAFFRLTIILLKF